MAVWNATIARSFPELAIGDVEIIVKEVGLKCLQEPSHYLPPVFGFEKYIQGRVPADPEKMLGTFIKSMKDLPYRMDVLEDDGIPAIWLVWMHVENDIN